MRMCCRGRPTITLEVLRSKFHLPISKAAKELGMGVTVMKKWCRKFDITRWPYRKLHSMTKLIHSVKESNPAFEVRRCTWHPQQMTALPSCIRPVCMLSGAEPQACLLCRSTTWLLSAGNNFMFGGRKDKNREKSQGQHATAD